LLASRSHAWLPSFAADAAEVNDFSPRAAELNDFSPRIEAHRFQHETSL
jgi:hypothetical protein